MTAPATTGITPRAADLAAGLRELADWIDQHPLAAARIQVGNPLTLLAYCTTAAELREMGAALRAGRLDVGDQWAQYVRTFGGLIRVQAYSHRETVCDYKVTGERVEQVREWRLKESTA